MMKSLTTNYIVLALVALFMIAPSASHAQFLKKLGKKIEKAAERTVLDRADRETSKKTDEAIDDVMEGDGSKRSDVPASQDDQGDRALASEYTFDWTYDLVSNDGKEDVPMTLMLREDGEYMGMDMSSMGQGASGYAIMNINERVIWSLVDESGMKMAMRMRIPDHSDKEEDEDWGGDLTITELPGKVVAGYECEGYRLENDEMVSTVYLLPDPPVHLLDMSSARKNKQMSFMPKGMDPKILKMHQDALMMEADYQSKVKKKDRGTMRCTRLEKEASRIKTAGYQVFKM